MKKLLYFFFLSFLLTPSFSFAYTNQDWLKVPESQGSNTKITGTRSWADGRIASSTADIAADPAMLAKNIVKVGIVVAVAVAIADIIGAGVDYVNDPANNRIRYKKQEASTCNADGLNCQGSEYLWTFNNNYYSTSRAACMSYLKWMSDNSPGIVFYINSMSYVSLNVADCNYHVVRSVGDEFDDTFRVTAGKNTNYSQSAAPADQYVSYQEIGSRIKTNADAGDKTAQDFTLQTATDTDFYPESYIDSLLDANKKYKTDNETTATTTTKNADGTETTSTTKTDIPPACTWFSVACDWFDWTQKDEVPTSDEQDDQVQDDKSLPSISTDTFNFGGACPAPVVIPIPNPLGGSNNLTLSFETFCLWLTKLKPWVDVTGWIIAVAIIAGHRSSSDV